MTNAMQDKVIEEIRDMLGVLADEANGEADPVDVIHTLTNVCAFGYTMNLIGMPLPEPYDGKTLGQLYSLYYDTHIDYAKYMDMGWLTGLDRIAGKQVDMEGMANAASELKDLLRDKLGLDFPEDALLYSRTHPALLEFNATGKIHADPDDDPVAEANRELRT